MIALIYSLISLCLISLVSLMSYNEILNVLSEKAFEHFSEPHNIWDIWASRWEFFRDSHNYYALALAFVVYALALWSWTFNKEKAQKYSEALVRVGMAGMFIFAAYHKIIDPVFFAKQVAAYQFLPEFSVNFFAKTLPITELLLGLGLLFSRFNKENGFLLVGMFLMFIVALSRAAIMGMAIDCGCFESSTGAVDSSGIYIALIRDIVLLPACIWLMFRNNRLLWK